VDLAIGARDGPFENPVNAKALCDLWQRFVHPPCIP
jgi:hypothetical protein